MAKISFRKEEKAAIVFKLQRYFSQELEQELGQFDAEFLLDFFSEHVGAYYYNQGLHDAQALFESQLEHVADAIYEIEQSIDG